MLILRKNTEFAKWLDNLKDRKAATRIMIRLDRLQTGNFGDWKMLGNSISELRIDYGPGYGIYFSKVGKQS